MIWYTWLLHEFDAIVHRKIPLLSQPFDRHRKIGVRGAGWAPQVVYGYLESAESWEIYSWFMLVRMCAKVYYWLVLMVLGCISSMLVRYLYMIYGSTVTNSLIHWFSYVCLYILLLFLPNFDGWKVHMLIGTLHLNEIVCRFERSFSGTMYIQICCALFSTKASVSNFLAILNWESMSMRLQIGDYSFYCHILSLLMLKIRMLGDPIVQSRSMGYLCYPSFSVGSTNKATFLQEAELFCMWHDRDIITVAEISYFLSYCPCLECPKIGFIWKNKYGWWFGTWLLFSISYMGCHPSWRTHIFQDGWNAPPTRYRLTISYLVDITNIAVENHHFLVGKSTISMAICNSKLLIITRDIAIDNSPLYHY